MFASGTINVSRCSIFRPKLNFVWNRVKRHRTLFVFASISFCLVGVVATAQIRERLRAWRTKSQVVDWTPAAFAQSPGEDAVLSEASILAAAKYSAAKRGVSFLVMLDGQLIYEDYPGDGGPTKAHELASGTKSFNGVMAAAAVDDGLIRWDEIVAETIDEWRDDPAKSKITVAQLLSLTSGISPKGKGFRMVPSYASAIANESITPPGAKFDYGPAAFQCFGEFMRRKLIADGRDGDPLKYLEQRIFKPIGLQHGRWRRDGDGNPHLPSGASLTAQQWAKFGELIRLEGKVGEQQVVSTKNLSRCFEGTAANPAYGLTFWMNQPMADSVRRTIPQFRVGTSDLTKLPQIPRDLVFAAGAGKQRLFIFPSLKLTVVRQADGVMDAIRGKDAGFRDDEFLELLLGK